MVSRLDTFFVHDTLLEIIGSFCLYPITFQSGFKSKKLYYFRILLFYRCRKNKRFSNAQKAISKSDGNIC